MPGPPSAQVLPRLVNPRKFAFQDTRLEGSILSAGLERLAAAVVKVHDSIEVKLHFYLNDDGKAVVVGEASVDVSMVCQRCLEGVAQNLRADIHLALVLNDEQSRGLPKLFDPWLIESDDGSANLHAMVEDELLLALPMVALHREFCIDESLLHTQAPNEKAEAEIKESPFSVLKQLQAPNKTSKAD